MSARQFMRELFIRMRLRLDPEAPILPCAGAPGQRL